MAKGFSLVISILSLNSPLILKLTEGLTIAVFVIYIPPSLNYFRYLTFNIFTLFVYLLKLYIIALAELSRT
jgi:hypothetical protein